MRSTSPAIQPSPGVTSIFAAALGHQLHADADAEERPAAPAHRLVQRLAPCRGSRRARAGNRRRRRRPAARRGRRARTAVRIAGDDDRLIVRRSRARRARRPWRPSADCRSRNRRWRRVIGSAPGSGNRPMTSRPVGGPRRTGTVSVGRRRRTAAPCGAAAGRSVHCAKKRRSALSRSSPTTKPSVAQPRRASVQRRMVAASKPTRSAIANAAAPWADAEAPSAASPAATAAVTTT